MRCSRVSHVAVAKMVAAIVNGPATIADMACESGLSEQTVRGYVRALRKSRAVHVAGRELDSRGRQSIKAYAFGGKPDAQIVPPRSRAEIARDYRARKKMGALLGVFA